MRRRTQQQLGLLVFIALLMVLFVWVGKKAEPLASTFLSKGSPF